MQPTWAWRIKYSYSQISSYNFEKQQLMLGACAGVPCNQYFGATSLFLSCFLLKQNSRNKIVEIKESNCYMVAKDDLKNRELDLTNAGGILQSTRNNSSETTETKHFLSILQLFWYWC